MRMSPFLSGIVPHFAPRFAQDPSSDSGNFLRHISFDVCRPCSDESGAQNAPQDAPRMLRIALDWIAFFIPINILKASE